MDLQNRNDDRTVTLAGIFHLIGKKLIWFLLIVFAFALFFGAMAYLEESKRAGELAAEPDETTKEVKVRVDDAQLEAVKAVAQAQDALDEKKKYMEDSILMNIDPYHKLVSYVRYGFELKEEEMDLPETKEDVTPQYKNSLFNGRIITPEERDRIILQTKISLATACMNAVKSSDGIRDIAQRAGIDKDVSFLSEIIAAENTSVQGTVNIAITSSSSQELDALTRALKEYVSESCTGFKEYANDYKVIINTEYFMELVDTALMDSQTTRKNEIANLETALSTKMAALDEEGQEFLPLYLKAREEEGFEETGTLKKTETVKKGSADIKGAVLKGTVKGLCIGLISAFVLVCIIYLFWPMLLVASQLYDCFSIPVLISVRKKKDADNGVEMLKHLTYSGDGKRCAIVSSREDMFENPVFGTLKDDKNEPAPLFSSRVFDRPVEIEKLRDAESVVLVEKIGVSKISDIDKTKRVLLSMGLKIRGAMVIAKDI